MYCVHMGIAQGSTQQQLYVKLLNDLLKKPKPQPQPPKPSQKSFPQQLLFLYLE